jgi:hypothetical protein
VVLVGAAVALVVELRKHAPPEPARLLPGADAFLYVNLGWMRRVNALDQLPAVTHDPEYEKFIQETGFQFERDLDRAAMAMHYPASWGGTTGAPSATEARFSWVFEGNLHAEKLSSYLKKISHSVETYRSTDIFSIPLDGRTLRVALLGVDAVAVSNHDDGAVIHGMIDRSRKLASPFGGPAFLRQYYRDVPIASLGWAIVRIPNPDARSSFANGWSMLLPRQGVVVASARYIRALHVRAEALTSNEIEARLVSEHVATFLDIFHSAEATTSTHGTDPDVQQFFNSLKIEQHSERAVLTATLPSGFIKKVFAEPPPVPDVKEDKSGTEGTTAAPAPAPRRKGRKTLKP